MDKYRKGQVNTMFWDDDNNQDYDYDKLRKDLVNDFAELGKWIVHLCLLNQAGTERLLDHIHFSI